MLKKFNPHYSWILAPLLLVLVTVLAYFFDPLFFRLNISRFSLHSGTRYYSRLQLWHYFVSRSQWSLADGFASGLDPSDTAYTLTQNHPTLLKRKISSLSKKSDITANDYLEIAQLYTRLGDTRQALIALESALKRDPLRNDLRGLYRQLTQTN